MNHEPKTAARSSRGAPRTASDHARIAPDVEPTWVEEFVLEQRLLGVPGDRIGDALALVQSHVAESGESAREAFGDPTAYAREAAPAARADDLDTAWFLGNGLGLAGMLLTVLGVDAWLTGEPVEVTVGWLVMAGLVAAAFLAMHLAAEPFLRLVLRRPWLSVGLFLVHFALILGVLLLFRAPVLHLPAAVTTALGVLALAVGTVLEWRSTTGGDLDDPLVGPGETASGRRNPLSRLTLVLFPLLTLALVGLTWLLHTLS